MSLKYRMSEAAGISAIPALFLVATLVNFSALFPLWFAFAQVAFWVACIVGIFALFLMAHA